MLLFPKVSLILWIGYKRSTRCGRVHFEHSHRKWLVITVRPTTSVRKSPRRIYRPATHPIHFAADSPDKIIAALRGRYFSFSQIKSYAVVQSSKICFWLFTAQPQSVILVLKRSRTQCPHCVRLSSYCTLNPS